MLSGPFLSREAKQINGGWVRGPSVCAAHHANCNAPLLPLASVLDSKGWTWYACTGVQLEADRVGIRWGRSWVSADGDGRYATLVFWCGGRRAVGAQCSAQKSPTFRTAHGFDVLGFGRFVRAALLFL